MSAFIRFFIWLFLVLLVFASFAFSGYNSVEVPLWIGFELPAQSLGFWIALAFTLGGALGLLLSLGLFRRIKYRVKIKQLQVRLDKAEQEIETLQGNAVNVSILPKQRE